MARGYAREWQTAKARGAVSERRNRAESTRFPSFAVGPRGEQRRTWFSRAYSSNFIRFFPVTTPLQTEQIVRNRSLSAPSHQRTPERSQRVSQSCTQLGEVLSVRGFHEQLIQTFLKFGEGQPTNSANSYKIGRDHL